MSAEELVRRRRRKRPRCLRSVDLPPNLDPATLAGLYEPSEQGLPSGGTSNNDGSSTSMMTGLLSTEWVERPLPPMSVLATIQTGRSGGGSAGTGSGAIPGPDCSPLLVDFLKSIGVGAGVDGDNDVQAKEGGTSGLKDDGDDGGDNNTANKDDQADSPTKGAIKPADAGTVDNTPQPAAPSAATPNTPEVEPIDDPNRSTLTAGQHKRYIQLWTELRSPSSLGGAGISSRAAKQITPREREFRSLDKVVRQEWAAYVQAMGEFRRRNADRFLLGFRERKEGGSSGDRSGADGRSAYEFVQSAAAAKHKRIASSHDDGRMTKVYGRCVQEVSLQDMAAIEVGTHGAGGGTRRRGPKDASGVFDMKSYAARIAHSTSSDGVARMDRDWVQKSSSSSSKTAESLQHSLASSGGTLDLSPLKSISKDDTAAKLAREQKVDVVMTAETFMELLRRPGLGDSRWMVPVSNRAGNDDWVVLEESIPRRATTREYLTSAYEDSVYGSAGRLSSSQTSKESSDLTPFQLVYTVLSLPKTSPQDGQCKVLVRSTNTLLIDDEIQSPVHLDVNLEYFYDRGVVEQCPHHRRAAWLAHKLLQPDCHLIFVRVDPNASRIISVSEKSVAHALAGGDATVAAYAHRASGDAGNLLQLPDFDAMSHFEAAARVIRAATTCKFSDKGGGALCLPGRGLSSATTNDAVTVSVHQEVENDSESDAAIIIRTEMEKADAVFTGHGALVSCFVPWEWKGALGASEIPFTFPMKKDME